MGEFAQALQMTPTRATPLATGAAPAGDPRRVAASAGGRRIPVAALALILGLLIGAGVLFAWRRNNADAPSGDERRIAVIPFQNLGDTADAYFADGITDAVRGKLTAIKGMRVTASNSTAEYRGTTKSPQEIGRELGVDFLLVGKVRWQKGAEGANRVQVSPELIEVATADARWQQPFDASLTDVFQVQADIAGRVAQALDLAIGSRQQQALEDRPTQNLAAYDAYLKGKAERARGGSPVTLRQAVTYFDQAVALDSTFVAAWAALSEASSLFYTQGAPSPSGAEQARFGADRAIALDPKHPDGYRALGDYYRRVAGNPARAVEIYAKGLAHAPDDADLLRGLGLAEQAAGKWDQAVERLKRSRSLDPRSPTTADALGQTLLWLRRYDEALEALDHSLALEPSSLQSMEDKAMVFVARGDLEGARAVLAQPPAGVDLPGFVAYMATYWDLYWVLSTEQRELVKRLRPSAFDGDVGTWGLALAGAYEVEGDMRRAAAYADSARIALEQQLTASPEDAQRIVLHGLALAYTGLKTDAVQRGLEAVKLVPPTKDTQSGSYYQHLLVRIYILTGEADKALDALEPLLKMPYYLSPGWLRIDPTFDPLRKHPRFRSLLGD
jgi:TolB-like protein/cytochrome c-type biogenesis protein CcmH/NrfG